MHVDPQPMVKSCKRFPDSRWRYLKISEIALKKGYNHLIFFQAIFIKGLSYSMLHIDDSSSTHMEMPTPV